MSPFIGNVFGGSGPPLPSIDVATEIFSRGKGMVNFVKNINGRICEPDESEKSGQK